MAEINIQKAPTEAARPVRLFEELEKRLDAVRQRAFELFESHGRELGHTLEHWLQAEHEVMGWPAAELVDKQGRFDLGMTLPGYDPNDVEVTVTPTEIVVHAKPKAEMKMEGGKVVWTEFGPNDVYRRFELPEPIDVENACATLDKGMLHVMAEKRPLMEKTVAVQVA